MTKSSPSEAKGAAGKDRVIIGKVGKPHGVRGEVNVYPLTDFPERFDDLDEVAVGEAALTIERLKWQGGRLVVSFRGVDSRESAAELTGEFLSLPRDKAAPLDEGEYYVFDIVGLKAYDESGNFLGEVREVLTTGANDVYAVADGSGKELLIPALKQVVRKIDLAAGKMIVRPLPEYESDG